jgi:hypothetical protein
LREAKNQGGEFRKIHDMLGMIVCWSPETRGQFTPSAFVFLQFPTAEWFIRGIVDDHLTANIFGTIDKR